MKKINEISGKTIPLVRDDVDTDLIIPAQYLTAVTRSGYGEHLFKRLRDSEPKFVFNNKKYLDATILITKSNFGCGSSREHAVWSLQEAGIQAIIAISFSDIFYSNSAKNGLVLITLSEEIINKMLIASQKETYHLTINLQKQTILSGDENYTFEIDPFRKHCLINGLDDLDYLLSHKKMIEVHKMNQNYERNR